MAEVLRSKQRGIAAACAGEFAGMTSKECSIEELIGRAPSLSLTVPEGGGSRLPGRHA